MGSLTAREFCHLREQDAKNARKARKANIASRTTSGEQWRHASRRRLDFPAFNAFTAAGVVEEKVEDDAHRIRQEELFEVEEGPRISVQLPRKLILVAQALMTQVSISWVSAIIANRIIIKCEQYISCCSSSSVMMASMAR